MGVRNYLIEGVSCSGKTSVCRELQRRGYQAFNGDTDLAYQGDPETGEPAAGSSPGHHIWHVGRVEALVANQDEAVTFFCGGSRNFSKFVTLFDGAFVLEVDLDTLHRRLDNRVDEWGSKPAEREIVVRLHQTKEQIPSNGIVIDATAPLEQVVDEIVRQSEAAQRQGDPAERPDQRAEPRRGPGPGAVQRARLISARAWSARGRGQRRPCGGPDPSGR